MPPTPRNVRRLIVLPALIAAVALLAGCENGSAPPRSPKAESKQGLPGGPVRLAAAQKQFLTIEAVSASKAVDVLMLPGRVTFTPRSQSAVGATAAGRVVEVLVRTGQKVKAGTPLLKIDSADAAAARAALEQANTRLATAESVYGRNLVMIEKGVGLEVERQEAEARLNDARTEHRRAKHIVALLGAGPGGVVTVTAPSDGVVALMRVAVGATVAPGGEALLELGNPSLLQVVAQVAEGDLSGIAPGQEAEVELPALAARVAARVETFNPRVDPESRRMQVYLTLAKRVEGMQAGMLAQVALRAATDAAIVVPVSAVLIKDGKRRVVYVEQPDGGFAAREVRVGRNRDGQVTILEGLAAGDRVVVRGALLLDTQAEQLL